jgi:hypothetical protein
MLISNSPLARSRQISYQPFFAFRPLDPSIVFACHCQAMHVALDGDDRLGSICYLVLFTEL